MAEAAVVTELRRFKAGVLEREAGQMQLMAQRWLRVEEALESQISSLAEEVLRLRSEGPTVTRGKLYRLERYHKLLAQAQMEFAQYAQWADGIIVSGQQEFALLGIEHAQNALGVLNVGMGWDRLNAGAVSNMIGMTAEGQPLGDLLKVRMTEARVGSFERLSQTLVNASAQGWNPRKTARLMRGDLAEGLQKSLTIARTEQLRAYRMAGAAQYKASGVISGVARLCDHSDRTCMACLADEGHVYSVDEGVPDHINGRCSQIPIVKGQEAPQMETGEQWFQQQDEATQRAMMGAGRFNLWQQGNLKFSDLARTTYDDTWGGGLRVTTLKELSQGSHLAAPSVRLSMPKGLEASLAEMKKSVAQLVERAPQFHKGFSMAAFETKWRDALKGYTGVSASFRARIENALARCEVNPVFVRQLQRYGNNPLILVKRGGSWGHEGAAAVRSEGFTLVHQGRAFGYHSAEAGMPSAEWLGEAGMLRHEYAHHMDELLQASKPQLMDDWWDLCVDVRTAQLAAGRNFLEEQITAYAGHAANDEVFAEVFAIMTDESWPAFKVGREVKPLFDFMERLLK